MVTDSKYAFDAPPPAPRFRFADPVDDDALSDWIAEDAQALLREQRPVELSRYLNACPNLRNYQVSLDTAIEMTLQSMAQRQSGGLSQCASTLAEQHPELADRIQIAAELSAAMNSTSLFKVLAQVVSPVQVPSDFGPPLGDGRPRYELREMLGQGSEGVVYLAVDRLLSDPTKPAWVAVKMLSERVAGSHRKLARHDEAVRARRVNHPNVVRAIDRGVSGDIPYAVFEYVQGKRLDAFAGQARVSPKEAARIVAAVADGLQAIHSAGLIHCDLKPANILVDAEGQARIADFGLAQYQPQFDAAGQDRSRNESAHGYGTLAFVAPEQFRRLPGCLAPPADIYALGGLLFWLLTGNTPNGTTAEQARKLLAREPSEGEPDRAVGGADFTGDLGAICKRALAMDPAKRYVSAALMAADLRAFLQLRPLEWNRPSLRHRAKLLARREPLKITLSVLALVGIVGTAAAATWSVAHARVVEVENTLRTERQQASLQDMQRRAAEDRGRMQKLRTMVRNGLKDLNDTSGKGYSEGWLPLLSYMEYVSGAKFLEMQGETEIWSLRFKIVHELMDAAAKRGSTECLEYLQWQTINGFWLMQNEQPADALKELDHALAGFRAMIKADDPWIMCVQSLRDSAATQTLSEERLRNDHEAVKELRDRLTTAANSFGVSRPVDPARRATLNSLIRLTSPETGADPALHERWLKELGPVRPIAN